NVYKAQGLKFDPYARRYSGGTDDLKYGYHGGAEIRIAHFEGWEQRADSELRRIGIFPDAHLPAIRRTVEAGTSRSTATNANNAAQSRGGLAAPPGAAFSMVELSSLVMKFQGAYLKDLRSSSRGRLWVEDPLERASLADALRSWGFRWANSRKA